MFYSFVEDLIKIIGNKNISLEFATNFDDNIDCGYVDDGMNNFQRVVESRIFAIAIVNDR